MTIPHVEPAEEAVYTPEQVMYYAKKQISFNHEFAHKAIPFPIPFTKPDEPDQEPYIAPLMPGEVALVGAQTSNGKSYLMHHWEDHMARYIKKNNMNSYVVSIATEEPIEQLGGYMIGSSSGYSVHRIMRNGLGKSDWNKIEKSMEVLEDSRIIRIGKAYTREYANPSKRPPDIHTGMIFNALHHIKKNVLGEDVEFAALFLDYLQTLAYDPSIRRHKQKGEQRRLQVTRDMYMIRGMGIKFAMPCIIASQAKPSLSAPKEMYIPDMYEAGFESSYIGFEADRIISPFMPKTKHYTGSQINFRGFMYTVRENTTFIQVVKQRGGLPSGQIWECEMDFKTGGYKIIRPVKINGGM